MKTVAALLLTACICSFRIPSTVYTKQVFAANDTIPFALPASFEDDYGIKYSISDTLWLQQPNAKYHILRWNTKEQYIIAKMVWVIHRIKDCIPGLIT